MPAPAYRAMPSSYSAKSTDDTAKMVAGIAVLAVAIYFFWPTKAKATGVTKRTAPPADNADREIPAQAAPAVTYESYTVKTGDSLSQIAANFYGDGKKPSTRGDQNWKWWPIIYDLNAETVKHPSKIRSGMVLKIPKKADLPLAKQAEYFARAMTF